MINRLGHGVAFRWWFIHLLALWALGVAQPLFDVVVRNAEFFVAHRASGLDLVLLAISVGTVLPAMLAAGMWLVGLASPLGRHVGMVLMVMALATLIAGQALEGAAELDPWPAIGVSALGGFVFSLLYVGVAAVRSFTTFLTPAIVVVPLVFLVSDSVSGFWARAEADASPAAVETGQSVPVVVVAFDQLPLASLLDAHGEVDARLFPKMAALANESLWFRDATAVSDRTDRALPAILTGMYPRSGALPRAADHPDNLFTWLGATHRLQVVEPLTFLCPSSLCEASALSTLSRVGAMIRDLTTVYLHIAAPRQWESELPPVDQDWRNFEVPLWQQRWIGNRDQDRRLDFLTAIDAMGPDEERPSLHFIHALLPHEPYVYYPSGTRFRRASTGLLGLERGERWTSDPWPVALNYQVHLNQVRMVDDLVGRLVTRLRAVDLYDRALVVVTADHGASFRPGRSFKLPTRENYGDIMAVPLFIKLPGQTSGRVIRGNVETVDVLPTMAEILGRSLSWETHGRSALGTLDRSAKRVYVHEGRQRLDFDPAHVEISMMEAVRLKLEQFGSPVRVDRINGLGPHWELVGRTLQTLQVISGEGTRISVDTVATQTSGDLDEEFLAGLITGEALADAHQGNPVLAVTVNDRVEAIGRVYFQPGVVSHGRWAALVPEEALRNSESEVRVFEVRETGQGEPLLRDIAAASPYPSNDRPGTETPLPSRGSSDLERPTR